MRDTVENVVINELQKYGVEGTPHTNGKHVKITWINAAGDKRCITVAKSHSDYRATLNMRAQARRMLKEDGMLVVPQVEPKTEVSLIEKLFEPPTPQEPLLNRVNTLEKHLKDLEEFVIEALIDQKANMEIEVPERESIMYSLKEEKPRRKYVHGTLEEVIYDELEYQFPKSSGDIAYAIDRSPNLVSTYLTRLKNQNRVKKLKRGQWVRVPMQERMNEQVQQS